MSDETRDAGGALWARPQAPDLGGEPIGAAPGWSRPTPPPPASPLGAGAPSLTDASPGRDASAPPPPGDAAATPSAATGHREPPPLPVWWAGFAAILAAYALLIVVLGLVAGALGGDTDGPGFTIVGTFVQDGVLVLMALVFARLGTGPGGLVSLGWRRLPDLRRALGIAALVVVAFYVIGSLYGSLVNVGDDASKDTVDALGLETGTVRLVASAVLLTLVAPLVEETVFRGLLFGALWRWKGWVFGAIVSGICFGGIHAGGAEALALPVLALLGFGLAFLYWRTGSLVPGIGVHSFNNAVTLAVTLKWSLGPSLLLVLGAPMLAMAIAWRFSAPPRSDPAGP